MTMTEKRVVTPNDQTIRKVFGQQKAFFIDIYQREYRWQERQVKTLPNDVEMRFGLFARVKHGDPKTIQEDVASNFDPYYVNTFLTHATVDGKINERMLPEIGNAENELDKIAKITNILTYLRKNGLVVNVGTDSVSHWNLCKQSGEKSM